MRRGCRHVLSAKADVPSHHKSVRADLKNRAAALKSLTAPYITTADGKCRGEVSSSDTGEDLC